jgi:tetratricopeptide (TPR) repeat protein
MNRDVQHVPHGASLGRITWRPGMGRRIATTLGALALVCVVLVAVGVVMLRREVVRAVAATQPVIAAANAQDFKATCERIPAAADAWNAASVWSRPLAPLLRAFGWLPRIGGDLRAAPDAVALARHGTRAGLVGCEIAAPVFADAAVSNRLSALAQQLATEPERITDLLVDLQRARAASDALAPSLERSTLLAPYREQLATVNAQLPRAIDALAPLYQLRERLPWLLGMDAPRRYLLALQNPFELRATGGFLGLVCSVEVARGNIRIAGCRATETYDVPAPATVPMPAPYSRYLRLGGYYLRDANWAPDFPTTAERLQEFWELNGEPAADGVVAVDMYALLPLIAATGDLMLDDGTTISAEQVVDSLLTRYYDDEVYRDKTGIGQLLPSFMQQLLSADPGKLRSIAGAMQEAIAERHVLFAFDDRATMTVVRRQGWAGQVAALDGDVVRVVDTDVGYGGVNAFVERLTSYDVVLDATGTPVSATLTLTYTNRYSPWAEAPTAHAVFGLCTDPATLQLERREGCYANYLRVYVPEGSVLDSSEGLEESFAPDARYGRAVFGGYLRVMPGEQCVVRFRYQLPALKEHTIRIEKQPGTDEPPVALTVRQSERSSTTYALLTTDHEYRPSVENGTITLNGAADDLARTAFEQSAAFNAGLARWTAGDTEGALREWQIADAHDRVLDYARALHARGATDEALRLVEAIEPVVEGGRGVFERAAMLADRGDAEADALYERAAALSPDQPLAQLMWGYRVALRREPVPSLNVEPGASAVRRWRNFINTLDRTDAFAQELAAISVLVRVEPEERVLALKEADLLFQLERRDEAFARYQELARTEDIYGLLAAGRYDQLNGREAEATATFVRAIALAPNEPTATRIGDALRNLGDPINAGVAYERALELSVAPVPEDIRPVLANGLAIRSSDPQGARRAYEHARAQAPVSGYPDYLLGRLLLEEDDPAGAVSFFEAAMEREPGIRLYRDMRDLALGLSKRDAQ